MQPPTSLNILIKIQLMLNLMLVIFNNPLELKKKRETWQEMEQWSEKFVLIKYSFEFFLFLASDSKWQAKFRAIFCCIFTSPLIFNDSLLFAWKK